MRIIKILTPLLILTILILPIVFLPKLITIKRINCSSQFGPCRKDLQDRVDLLSGRRLDETKKELKKILSEEIVVKDYYLQYKFPDILKIDLLETKPRFALKSENQNFAIIDDGGKTLSYENSTNLPVIVAGSELPNVGEEVDQKTFFALNIIYDMFVTYGVKTGILTRESLELNLPDGKKIFFPLEGNRDVLMGSLSLILSRLNDDAEITRIEGIESISEIDLRYKNPVLR